MTSPSLDDTFAALADPTRRAVIRALVERPRRAGELAAQVQMSPPALSRHLRVLRQARLVVADGIEEDARVQVYRLAPAALAEPRAWLDELEQFWSQQLQSFKAHAEAGGAKARRGSR